LGKNITWATPVMFSRAAASKGCMGLFHALLAGAEIVRLSSGDWVGQIRTGDVPEFAHVRFAADTVGARVVIDLPSSNKWGIRGVLRRGDAGRLEFAFPLAGDTAAFVGSASPDSIDGTIRGGARAGTLHLVHRMAYDSAVVRPLAGNYAIDAGRMISMGPMDEASGWLSFFDSQTLRGGILYALNDSVFFTGPSFSIDYPIAIRVVVRRDESGAIRALRWEELGKPAVTAKRLRDFSQEDVSFTNGGVRLAGNLTLPAGRGRHPAVVLIHGCCGTIPTRDFGYWSAYLAHHGIAVLAFDKRGGGASTGNANTASYEDLADDVLAGVTLLAHRADIDPKAIGVYGMSNGGYIAPLAAVRSHGRIAFVAVRSGSSRRVGGNIDYEVGNDLRSEGFSEDDVRRGVAIRRRVTDFVIAHPTIEMAAWDSLKSEVAAVQKERWFPWSRTQWVPYVSPADSGGLAYVNALRKAWEYDPIPFWKQVRIPVYIMLGALDRSVPTDEAAPALRSALEQAHNADATVRVYSDGNHGLLRARTGYEREVSALGYYVPHFQADLAAWILRHARRVD
jgi:dienelactone hydrolase